jgi:hypothetical protein
MSTLPQTLNLNPIIDFPPTKIYPSFSTPINQKFVIANVPTGNATYTPAQVIGGFIIHTANGASTGTLPTADLLIPQIQGAEVGSGFKLIIYDPGTATLTIAAGVGGTMLSVTPTIATLTIREFLIIVTSIVNPSITGSVNSYTVYSLGVGTAQ